MSPEQQRIAIAEACGWTGFNPDNIPDCLQYTACAPNGKWGMIPDYLNDLNAMHEAEKVLSENPIYMQQHAFNNYAYALIDACKHQCNAVSATAAQRAEAFLRTLNLWAE